MTASLSAKIELGVSVLLLVGIAILKTQGWIGGEDAAVLGGIVLASGARGAVANVQTGGTKSPEQN